MSPEKNPSATKPDERLLVASVRDCALFALDPEGRISTWNPGASRATGRTAANAIGAPFARLFVEADVAHGVPGRLLAEAEAVGCAEREGVFERMGGAHYWATLLVNPIRTKGAVSGYAVVMRDTTARKEAQDALLENDRRLRLLVEGVTDYAIYMLDPSGIVTNWNTGARRLKGYEDAEIIGQHFARFYTKEDRAAGKPARVLATAEHEGRFEGEGWRVRKDGSRFWASVVVDAIRDEAGKLIGFAKITRDITERRAAQEALRESERQFRLLVRGVSDYALFMLDPNGVVSSWNSGAERIKGYTSEEIIGQHFSKFYTEGERSAGLPLRALETARREGRYEAEGWRVRKNGGLFMANVVIDAIRDDDGRLVGFAKITRDITERKKAEAALEAAQAERAYAQKMEALGRLTGGVAHDFNNLLMILGGHVQTLKRLAGDDPKAQRATEAIEHAAQKGAVLTRQLLAFSRRQSLKPEVADLASRISSVQAMLESAVGASIRIETQAPEGLWPVWVDSNELEFALVNLALNARDAMPAGGLIVLSAENVTLAGESGLNGEFVAVTVADTGQGIAPDILPRVFDPFFTTKPVNKGTGLGLSQVHGFAHQLGGGVAIDSRLGEGTRVTLFLPKADRAPSEASSGRMEETPAGRILIVEDNPDVADATRSMLEDLGWNVEWAPEATTALSRVKAEDFDLVLSDIVMAGSMDGLALARAIRTERPNLPVALATGYAENASAAEEEFTVLRKPYELPDLSRALAKATGEARAGSSGNVVRLRSPKGKPGSTEKA